MYTFFFLFYLKNFTWKKYLHNDLYLNGYLILLCMHCCCWVILCHCIYKDSFSSLFLCLRIWRRCCLSPHTLGNSCTQLFMPAQRSCCSAFSRPSSPTLCITGKRSLFVCYCCICLFRTKSPTWCAGTCSVPWRLISAQVLRFVCKSARFHI